MENAKLSEKIDAAIEAKCGSIVSLNLAWKTVVSKAVAAGFKDSDLVLLISILKSPTSLDKLTLAVAEESEGGDVFFEHLRNLVDASDYGLADWVAAIELVLEDLAATRRTASASSIMGYVQCSAEAGDAVESPDSLAEMVSQMIQEYGFEGQQGCGYDSLG